VGRGGRVPPPVGAGGPGPDWAANAIGALAGIVLSGMLTRKMRKKA